MPSSWHQFHQNLTQSSSTLNFQRGFTAIKSAFPALSQFADPTALLEHLHRGTATSLQKNLVLQDLIKAAKANSRSGDSALTLMLLALWPGLDGVFRRSRARRLGELDEIASEILARATASIRELDLAQVNWVAATILMNVERDVLRAYQREASRLSKQVEFETDLHGGIADFVDPDLSPERLLAELTDLIGVDAELVLRVVIDGYTQAEAGKEIGLSEPAARKRFQRALKRLRDHAKQKS